MQIGVRQNLPPCFEAKLISESLDDKTVVILREEQLDLHWIFAICDDLGHGRHLMLVKHEKLCHLGRQRGVMG
jgi:hypothetical protein